jgi:hypothetical protein
LREDLLELAKELTPHVVPRLVAAAERVAGVVQHSLDDFAAGAGGDHDLGVVAGVVLLAVLAGEDAAAFIRMYEDVFLGEAGGGPGAVVLHDVHPGHRQSDNRNLQPPGHGNHQVGDKDRPPFFRLQDFGERAVVGIRIVLLIAAEAAVGEQDVPQCVDCQFGVGLGGSHLFTQPLPDLGGDFVELAREVFLFHLLVENAGKQEHALFHVQLRVRPGCKLRQLLPETPQRLHFHSLQDDGDAIADFRRGVLLSRLHSRFRGFPQLRELLRRCFPNCVLVRVQLLNQRADILGPRSGSAGSCALPLAAKSRPTAVAMVSARMEHLDHSCRRYCSPRQDTL